MNMKKIYKPLCAIWILLLAIACDDNQEKFYSGEPSLYLDLTNTQLDSIVSSFMNVSEDRIVIELPVVLSGYAVDKDRSFRLKVDTEKSTAIVGKHYQALEEQYTIEKGKYSVNVPVTLLYDRELDSVTVRLLLRLETTDEFSAGVPYRQQVMIVSSNLLPAINPVNWNGFYSYYFGEYSKVKHRYILSVLKLNDTMHFEDVMEWYKVPSYLKSAYSIEMNNFFANNNIPDENGNRIEPWI